MDIPFSVPRLYVKSRGEQTTKLSLMLTQAKRRFVVRITGGCGKMTADEAEGLYGLFRRAMFGFDGAVIFGGTRMLRKDDPSEVVPGVTEIAPAMRESCPEMTLLGIVPRTQDIDLSEHGLVVSHEGENPYFTIVHPTQDIVLVVQVSADDAEIWDAEYGESLRIVADLRTYAKFGSVTVSYNGGGVTEREVRRTAALGWPVILVKGSGRVTDDFAVDREFLLAHPSVIVAEKDPYALRDALSSVGAVPSPGLALVRGAKGG